MSEAETSKPAGTAVPLNKSVPAPGGVSIRSWANVWPASASLKPKSVVNRVYGVSSGVLREVSVPEGGALPPTLTTTVAADVPPCPSAIP